LSEIIDLSSLCACHVRTIPGRCQAAGDHAALNRSDFIFVPPTAIAAPMRPLLALLLLLLAAAPAAAASTPWQQVAQGVRLRLISSDSRTADGKTLVGLELDMPQSFKTYWRLPGETGIPTELDIAGSTGVSSLAIKWPFPAPELTSGFLDYVYHGPTVLPVELTATGDAPLLVAAVTMGVCSEVCVPVRARFSLPLSFAVADAGQTIRLRQAEALVPIAWDRPAPPFGAVAYDRASRSLRLVIADPAIDSGSLIASTSDPMVVFDTPQKSPDGQAVLLKLRGADGGLDWAKSPIQFTFMTAMGSYEVDVQVTATSP
jgi:DsbC/DsbD-like thiol-disulfide interchange protein